MDDRSYYIKEESKDGRIQDTIVADGAVEDDAAKDDAAEDDAAEHGAAGDKRVFFSWEGIEIILSGGVAKKWLR